MAKKLSCYILTTTDGKELQNLQNENSSDVQTTRFENQKVTNERLNTLQIFRGYYFCQLDWDEMKKPCPNQHKNLLTDVNTIITWSKKSNDNNNKINK